MESDGDPTSPCFHTCIFKMMGSYGPNGLNSKVLKRLIGSNNMMGEESGWKKQNADKILDKCLSQINTKSYIECNEDLKSFSFCYFAELFMACPDFNESNC